MIKLEDMESECCRQLEFKFGDVRAKNQQLASLADSVNNLTDMSNLLQEHVDRLVVQLDLVNADNEALKKNNTNMAIELKTAERSKQDPKEDVQI